MNVYVLSGPTLRLDSRVSHAVLNERYHFNKQTPLDRDGRQCMSAGITYSYCRLRPIVRDVDQFVQVAMGMKQWDCVSSGTFSVWFFYSYNFMSLSVQYSTTTRSHKTLVNLSLGQICAK